MIKEFDTMFPRCLWVAKETNYKELSDKFQMYFPTSESEIPDDERKFNEDTFDEATIATVYLAKYKISGEYGYLVILNDDKFDLGTCAHEASHVVTHLEAYFGLESNANEYRAYMTEWFTKRIEEVWNDTSESKDVAEGAVNDPQPVAE